MPKVLLNLFYITNFFIFNMVKGSMFVTPFNFIVKMYLLLLSIVACKIVNCLIVYHLTDKTFRSYSNKDIHVFVIVISITMLSGHIKNHCNKMLTVSF